MEFRWGTVIITLTLARGTAAVRRSAPQQLGGSSIAQVPEVSIRNGGLYLSAQRSVGFSRPYTVPRREDQRMVSQLGSPQKERVTQ